MSTSHVLEEFIDLGLKTCPKDDCRVCLENIGVHPIFGDEQKPDISMELTTFGGIQVDKDDDFPQHICNNCFSLLESAIGFRQTAKRIDTLLKRRKRKLQCAAATEYVEVENQIIYTTDINQLNETVNTKPILLEVIDMKTDSAYLKSETMLNGEVIFEDNIDSGHKEESEMVTFTVPDDNRTTNSNSMFNCNYCKMQFPFEQQFEEHRATREHKRNYVISFLPKKPKKYNDDATAEKSLGLPKDDKCDICGGYFSKLQYSRHMLNAHDIKVSRSTKRECSICKLMLDRRSLPRHMKRKHGTEEKQENKPKVECPICKKILTKQVFPMHMKRHKDIEDKKYICDQCGRKFAFKSSFKTHCLVHTNEYPHKCECCPYQGRTKGLLKIHMRTHTGDYPYMCTQCDTRCQTKSNLNWHLRRHRGPVDFICGSCNKGFYSKLQLDRHISVSHYGEKNHICTYCGTAFGYRNGLLGHVRKVHRRPKLKGELKPKPVCSSQPEPEVQNTLDNQMPAPTYIIQNFVY